MDERVEGRLGGKLKKLVWSVPLLLFVYTILVFVTVVDGDWDVYGSGSGRTLACAGFLLWGLVYYLMSFTAWKTWFGLIQITAGLWNDWYQLGQLGDPSRVGTAYDRLVFIAAGLAVIAHGWGDFVEGSAIWERNRNSRRQQKLKAASK